MSAGGLLIPYSRCFFPFGGTSFFPFSPLHYQTKVNRLSPLFPHSFRIHLHDWYHFSTRQAAYREPEFFLLGWDKDKESSTALPQRHPTCLSWWALLCDPCLLVIMSWVSFPLPFKCGHDLVTCF